ncbi:MAG: hypothetical protein WKG00_19355 [Polyangiaceae bacterium]
MRFAELAEVSRRVAETTSRNGKVAVLAETLGRLTPDEAPVVVAWLAGQLPQGKLGVGWAMVRAMGEVAPAEGEPWSVLDVDRQLSAIAGAAGPGSTTERRQRLAASTRVPRVRSASCSAASCSASCARARWRASCSMPSPSPPACRRRASGARPCSPGAWSLRAAALADPSAAWTPSSWW